MRKFIAMCLVGLSLGACSTTQVQQAEQIIAQVQQDAAVTCKFIPTVATILSVINAAAGATVGAITSAICAAVPAPASARYGAIHRAGAGLTPSQVGVTPVGTTNVPITGWRTQ